jgi:hypothetical protein
VKPGNDLSRAGLRLSAGQRQCYEPGVGQGDAGEEFGLAARPQGCCVAAAEAHASITAPMTDHAYLLLERREICRRLGKSAQSPMKPSRQKT